VEEERGGHTGREKKGTKGMAAFRPARRGSVEAKKTVEGGWRGGHSENYEAFVGKGI